MNQLPSERRRFYVVRSDLDVLENSRGITGSPFLNVVGGHSLRLRVKDDKGENKGVCLRSGWVRGRAITLCSYRQTNVVIY